MFSNSAKYAIRAVLYLASKSDESNKLKADHIAEELGIPKHFLAKIMQQLTKHKVVSSMKGRNGGFYLNENNRSSSLLNVIEAIDGPVTLNNCILGLNDCSDKNPCPYHFAVAGFRRNFYNQLKTETIDYCSARIDMSKLKIKN